MADQEIDIAYVAQLARLELTQTEAATFGHQLGDILGHVARLQAIDTEGIEPTAHATDIVNAWAADVAEPSLPPSVALQHAPSATEEAFLVPKVLADG
jgi:aspartyl-tRNA(Asn)/glutamyl-tRNA(Gln) amidotransferase subunit C